MAVATITADLIRNLKPPPSGQTILRDDKLKGFALRITTNGAISFLVHVTKEGVERRHTLGPYPTLSVALARDAAKRFRQGHLLGQDPIGHLDRQKLAPRVIELWDRYQQEHLPTKSDRAAADERSMWRDYVLPALAERLVGDLVPDDIDALHRKITISGKRVRANRVHESLRKALSLAVRWGWAERNVAQGVKRNGEQSRQRYASEEELRAIWKALDELNNRSAADVIAMLLLTGARRSEVLRARWDHFDLKAGTWTKPPAATKQKRLHRVPLSLAALTILKRRRMEVPEDIAWVFPGRDPAQPLSDIKRAWKLVRDQAGLEDFHLHDLRHTFASRVVSDTGSLYVAGQLLGHTQAQTTARYAHLLDDAMRDALDQVSDKLTAGHR